MANELSINKDLIMMHWDGEVPYHAPDSAIHGPEDVIHFWEHLNGYMRWSKRGYYYMDFGKQNLKRLHSQFGRIKVKFGSKQIDKLKEDQANLYDWSRKLRAARDMPIESLPVYNYKVKPLGEYQHRGVVMLVNAPRVALYADCGLGKTYMVLVSTEKMMEKGLIESGDTLVVGKLITLEDGWMEDVKTFTNLNAKILWDHSSYKRKDKVRKLIEEPADVYLINHDGLRVYEEELKAKKFKRIIVDESTIIKSFHGMNPRIKGGQIGRSLINVSQNAEWKAIMSGTPSPNGPWDMWGQFYFLDNPGLIMEPTFRDFKRTYYEVIDLRPMSRRLMFDKETKEMILDSKGKPKIKPLNHRDPRKEVPKKGTLDAIAKLIEPLTYRLRARDHLDLPPLNVMIRRVRMSPGQRKHYDSMDKELKVVINDERITAPVKLAQSAKLRQITGGFIFDHSKVPHEMPNGMKFEMLDSLVEDEIAHDEQIIISCEFRWEIESIVKRYKHYNPLTAYGGHSTSKSIENMKKFKSDKKYRLFILHPKSAGHGVTLTNACYMIFYSYSHSWENNYQVIKRIDRASQLNPMFVYYLSCRNSIDIPIYSCITGKEKDQAKIDSQLLKYLKG